MIGRILGRKRILSDREAELRAREQELLSRLARSLEHFGPDVSPDDLKRFQEAREQLTGFFLLVVAGEFNSGKSSFINALLGERVLPEGVTPTTDRINVLRYGPEPGEELQEAYLLERVYPSALLREMNIVDTPGTNAIIRRHEELTREFIPRCDLVLFVTSADRPFTESERGFLEHIRQWGKKIVMVINKIDILSTPQDVQEVIDFVRQNAQALLGQTPEIFPVSARKALASRESGDEQLWHESGFEAVERYLLETLDQEERVRLKLLSPLNVGLRLASIYKEESYKRLKLLAGDIATIENIDQQLRIFHEEMLRDFQPRLASLEILLQEMEARGMAFFDDTVRLRRIKSLVKSDAIRAEFEEHVIADTPQRIEQEVVRIIDWIVERNLKLWQDINSYIDRRQIARHREEIIGEVGYTFNYNRQALLDSIGRTSRDVIISYNHEAEARELTEEVRSTFATTALAEAGAVGLGALVILTQIAWLDFTGLLAGTLLAAGGLYIIPAKRRQVKRDFHKKISDLRAQLVRALTRQVNNEIAQSTERINEAIAPYRRFVKLQQEQLTEVQAELVTVEDALQRLKAEIEG